MQIIDLTHFITGNMPVYPGTEQPKLINEFTIEKNGYAEKLITMFSHTGTHIDAPAHMIKNANGLDNFPVEQFYGKGIVIDISKFDKEIIEEKDITFDFNNLCNYDFVLFYSGWSKLWGKEDYFYNFPVLSEYLVKKIVNSNLKGLGFDSISIDPVCSVDYVNHYHVLRKNKIIIENLTNLDKLIGKDFVFCCFPLKIKECDGSPIRAVGFIE
ncbi:MAG: cyclase family protein [bacterium]